MKRDTQLDTYRALSMMYIVCVIHYIYWFGIGSEPLRSALLFEMPAIFFIAGASQSLKKNGKGNSFGKMLIGRAKRILIPYYIYLPILYIWLAAMTFIMPENGCSTADIRSITTADIIKTVLTGGSNNIPYYGYTWFISCYLIISLSLPIQKRILSVISAHTYMVLASATVLAFSFIKFPVAENEIKNIPLYNFFYIAGYLYYRNYSVKALYTVTAIASLICIICFYDGTMIPMQDHKFPADFYFLIFGTACIGILSICLRKISLPYTPIMDIWNVRGYTIYLYQNISLYTAMAIAWPILQNIGNQTIKSAAFIIIIFMANTIMSYPAFYMEKRIRRLFH